MRTKLSPALNGVEMHALDPTIVVRGVQESSPAWKIDTGSKGEGVGLFINRVEKQSRSVTITFGIFARDPLKRSQVLQAVAAWAAPGGILTTDYRDGQWLRVICTQLPNVDNIREWTEDFQVTFTAYQIPYWSSTEKTQITIAAGTSGTATMNLKETAGGKLCAIVANNSGSSLASLGVFANGKRIALTEMSVASGSSIVLDYDDNDIQRIRKITGSTASSYLAYRTTDSDDYVPLEYGANTIIVSSSVAVSWTIYTYGRWQ
jgi:phage-related protein